jgi:hypothetical protein
MHVGYSFLTPIYSINIWGLGVQSVVMQKLSTAGTCLQPKNFQIPRDSVMDYLKSSVLFYLCQIVTCIDVMAVNKRKDMNDELINMWNEASC